MQNAYIVFGFKLFCFARYSTQPYGSAMHLAMHHIPDA